MPETTTWKHPYPLGTQTPDVPRDLKALADSCETADTLINAKIDRLAPINLAGLPHAQAAGIITVPVGAGTGLDIKTVTVTFPTNRFTVPPIITTALDGTGTAWAQLGDFTIKIASITKTQMSVTVMGDGTALNADVPFKVHWHALQMTPTSAAG